jgi:hypothetical protein
MNILKGWSLRTVSSLRGTDQIGETKQTASTKPSMRVVAFKRLGAAIMSFLAIYFAVGSYFYGAWWYGFLWRGRIFERNYITNGIFFLLDREILSVIIVLLLLGFLAVYVAIRKTWVLALLDRLWGWMVLASIFCILITSLVVYRSNKTGYEIYDSLAKVLGSLDELINVLGQDYHPAVAPPIAFRYLDKSSLESLYSQIMPELVEKERSIETDDKRQLKAGASGAGINGELGTEKGVQTKSSLQRVEFSSERKCIELINYSLKEGRAKYYINADAWFTHKALKEIADKFEQIRKDPENVKPNLFDTDSSPEAVERRRREIRQKYSANFIQELTALSGLVLLKGEFVVSQKDNTHVILKHTLSAGEPKKIEFIVAVPTVLPYATGERVRQLNVFARVDKPLDEKGEIGAQAIAVF